MVELDRAVRLVSLQFSFSNPNAVPLAIRSMMHETPDERAERKSRSTGEQVISPTENCSIADLPAELGAAGYELVDARYQPRSDEKNGFKRTYHMVRYSFVRREIVTGFSEEFRQLREFIRCTLNEMCTKAFWRVRAFKNPYYAAGKALAEQFALSINLEARKPLFQPDGKPELVWQRDERGQRVGIARVPLRPAHRLRVVSNAAQLVAA